MRFLSQVLAEEMLDSLLESEVVSARVPASPVRHDAAKYKQSEPVHEESSFLSTHPPRVETWVVEVRGGSKRLAHIRIFVHMCVRRVEKSRLNTKNSYININRGLSGVLAV